MSFPWRRKGQDKHRRCAAFNRHNAHSSVALHKLERRAKRGRRETEQIRATNARRGAAGPVDHRSRQHNVTEAEKREM